MSEIKNHILLMLGAPVVEVELNEEQISHCIEDAVEAVKNLCEESQETISVFRTKELVKQYALGRSMIILGHIRGGRSGGELDALYLKDKGYDLLDGVKEEISDFF